MSYLKEPWNWVHCFGSCSLAFVLYCLMINWWAFVIAFSCGVLWECADKVNQILQLEIWFLDSTGWDYRDLIMDAIGVLVAFISIWGFYA